MGNQQPSLEQRKVQRLSRKGVGSSEPKWCAPSTMGEDIVCALPKGKGVLEAPAQLSELLSQIEYDKLLNLPIDNY